MVQSRAIQILLVVIVIATCLTHGLSQKITSISIRNPSGGDLSSLLSFLSTESSLVKDGLFSQPELEIEVSTSNLTISCEGLKAQSSFCSFPNPFTAFEFGENHSLFPVCNLLTNRAHNCILTVDNDELRVHRRNGNNEMSSIAITSCGDELCAVTNRIQVDPPAACDFEGNPALRSIGLDLIIGRELFETSFENSIERSLTVLEEQISLVNLFVLAQFRSTLTVNSLSVEETNICATGDVAISDSGRTSIALDNCPVPLNLTAQGRVCAGGAAVSVSDSPLSFEALLEQVAILFSEASCVDFENCNASLVREDSICGNGIIEEGEECECAANQEECDCCNRCLLRETALCDGLNNECCAVDCSFKPVEDLCSIGVEGELGYCRLGSCKEANCRALGFNDFCGLFEENLCKTKCRLGEADECVALDENNPRVFVADGALCSTNGVCESGQCVITEKDESFFSDTRVLIGFTGVTLSLVFLVVVFTKCNSSSSYVPQDVTHYDSHNRLLHIQQQQQQQRNPASVTNPHFTSNATNVATNNRRQHSTLKPLPVDDGRKRSKWFQRTTNEGEVINTPHRTSVAWQDDLKHEVFAIEEDLNDSQSNLSSGRSSGRSLLSGHHRQKRVSVLSGEAPPGLGWRPSPSGERNTFYRE